MAGTFTTLIQSVAQKSVSSGNWVSQTAGPTFSTNDADLVNRMNLAFPVGTLDFWAEFPLVSPGQPAGNAEIRFNIDTSAITLTGDVVGTFGINGLPAGFQVLTAAFKFHTLNGASPGDSTDIIRSGLSVGSADPDAGTNWNIALDVSAGFLALFLDTYGFLVANTGGSSGASWSGNRQAGAGNTMLSGTYDLLGFQFTYDLDPPSGSSVNANTPGQDNGDIITISSDPGDPDALLLDELVLSVACGAVEIITQQTHLLTFRMPASCGTGGMVVLTATGNGTQFSGSVTLGILTVLLTDGSGIYILTPGATHDTLYSSERDGTTRNVKIPRPFGKTGFIGA